MEGITQPRLANNVLAQAQALRAELASKRYVVTHYERRRCRVSSAIHYDQATSRSPTIRKPSVPITPKARPSTEVQWYSDPKPSRGLNAQAKQHVPSKVSTSMRDRDRDRSRDDRLLELANANGQSKSKSRELLEEVNGSGITIRGLAGPYVVMASNFAPGTTSADIESAMLPLGGEMQSCRIMSSSPTVIAEMVFVEKKGADAVIRTFNNAKVIIINVLPQTHWRII